MKRKKNEEKKLDSYKARIGLNGCVIEITSTKTYWQDPGNEPGDFLKTRVVNQGTREIIYEKEAEITGEFLSYVEDKHRQVVERVSGCGSLEQIPEVIEGLFKTRNSF